MMRRCCRRSSPRRRGEIEPDRAVAQAKLIDAETVADAVIWLKPKERMVVLHDRALLGLLANLPEGPAHAGAEAPGH
jgi:membrane glycosyltransferase